MDFFESQDRARSRTKTLVALYVAAIGIIIVLIYLVAVFAGFGASLQETSSATTSSALQNSEFFDPSLFGIVSGLVILIVGGATLFKIKSLGSSGSRVAQSVGGREVDPSTSDPDERKLLNIVEEMSIASGVPMPDVFILPNEASINAFAAGTKVENAAVAVTKGAIQQLSRDELQGVIAHEFSHILSGDMRLNIRLIGPLFGLLVIAFLGRMFLYSGGRRSSGNNNSGGIVILGLAIMVIGYVGVIFGRMIQAAISRQREYLADASAVQFTRNPEGIGNALRRLGNRSLGSKVNHEHAEDTAHLFFASALGSSLATHPPLPKRIRAILPNWDGSFLPPRKEPAPSEPSESSPPSGGAGTGRGMIHAATAIAAVGALSQNGIREGIESKIRIRKALGDFPFSDPVSAQSVFLALILDEDPEARARQLEIIGSGYGEVASLFDKIAPLSISDRYAIMELCCSGLRKVSGPEMNALAENLDALAQSDRKISLKEALILNVVRSQMKSGQASEKGGSIKNVARISSQVAGLLRLITTLSCDDPDSARASFEKAVGNQYLLSGKVPFPDRALAMDKLEDTLEDISKATYGIRRQVIAAAAEIILEDEHATESEWTLLRLVSLSLGAPMPPITPS